METAQSTEEKIYRAARAVFHEQGYDGARMQEIAQRADINQSMLHYYFRTKAKLFEAVFKDSMQEAFPAVFAVLDAELPFLKKVERFVHTYLDMIAANPHLPAFVLHELHKNPERLNFLETVQGHAPIQRFMAEVRTASAAGDIRPIQPEHLVVNMIGLCVFPFIARPVIQSAFGADGPAYEAFLRSRKKEVSDFILNAIRP